MDYSGGRLVRRLLVYPAHAGLRLHRLDLMRRSITVTEQLGEVGGQLVVSEPKTKTSRRTIAVPRFLVSELENHLAARPASECDYVFTTSTGSPLRRTAFRARVWLPAVDTSVGRPMRFHDLRHSHAAILISQGEHPKVIASRLGHASIRTTLDVYGHLFDGLDDAAADRLDKLVFDSVTDISRTNRTIAEFRAEA